ncbi:hypothetical protein SAMN05421823_106246 [Catalinimonas alkaloidigena]|uniref:YceI-like domain-containing protein n=1 Tax=Catalinimonas alkaloidigena TaxID=1075417 RepID=A0A1G9KT28_9BACT|nr:hypothetical protein [Catalinimonas alkaloidigena]SDL52734.1 hypothetical protein SAMN05421823_106246 [Catalinimonas alkaloidigena]
MTQKLLLFVLVWLVWATPGQAQDRSRTNNNLLVNVSTPGSAYEYQSRKMTGKFNKNLDRFEFEVPLVSFLSRSAPPLSELLLPVQEPLSDQKLFINLKLPDRALNLGDFRGNRRLELQGEVRVGDITFNTPVEVEGLFRNNSEMILSFDIPLTGEIQALRDLHLEEMHLIAQDVRLYYVVFD